jgi:hypothetical protein
MLNLILALLPQETWQLLLVIAGLLIIVGCRQLGGRILGGVLLLAFFSPFIDSFLAVLPPEAIWILGIVGALMIIRLLLGRRVIENVTSYLIYDLIRAPFRCLGWFLRPRNR